MHRNVLAALAVILAVAGHGYAQIGMLGCGTDMYTVSGRILIPTNDHPDVFEVQMLSNQGERRIGITTADDLGQYCFSGLPAEKMDLVVRLEGFKELRESIDVGSQTPPPTVVWLIPLDKVVTVDERVRGYPMEAIEEYALAIEAASAKNYAEMVQHLEMVVKLAASWYDAHCELGAAYEELQRPADAEREYRKAVELKPNGMRGLMSLGRLLVAEADEKLQTPETRDAAEPILKQAREVLAEAISHDPKSAMASYMMGNVDFRLASYEDAEKELKRALELDPSIFPAQITLINVYMKQSQWQSVLDATDEFILKYPVSPYRQQVLATRASVLRILARNR